MPETGVPSFASPRPASHTSTQEWQSFEVRMRRRRLERCLVRAEVALEAGFPDDARVALDEARRLDPYAPQVAEIEGRMPPVVPIAATPPASRTSRYYLAAAAALVIVAGGAATWTVTARDEAVTTSPHVAKDVLLVGAAAAPLAATPVVEIRTDPLKNGDVTKAGDVTKTADAPSPRTEPLAEPVLRASATLPSPTPDVGPVSDLPGVTAVAPPPPPTLPVTSVNATGLPLSNATPASPPVDERARVRSVLAQYEAAYNNLDAGAAQAVWPDVDADGLARAFSNLQSQRFSLGRCDVFVSGATARANCSGTATWTPKVGAGRTQPRRWDFTLQNAGGNWQIVNASTR